VAGIVAPSVRALLQNLIDYAGMFPPALLSREAALTRYRAYETSEHAWLLGRFVISTAQADTLPAELWPPFTVLSDAADARADAIESKKLISTGKPTYCEVSIEQLDAVKEAGSFAKVRTGGITRDAIPSVDSVATYITACAERRLGFKATAGLHHQVRGMYRLRMSPKLPWR
jgi:hypothetical protein